jgi:hypothetical protein
MNAIVRRPHIDLRQSEAAMMMLVIAAGGAASVGPNPTIGFITQMWVLGSIMGTTLALLQYRRQPETPRWALFVGVGALVGAAIGVLVAIVDALLA